MSDNEQGGNGGGAPAPSGDAAATGHINIKVMDAQGAEVFFKIKQTTKLGKLMHAYADRQGRDPNQVRFLFDGNRVSPDDTPQTLEMEDNDSIEVQIEQVGGTNTNSPPTRESRSQTQSKSKCSSSPTGNQHPSSAVWRTSRWS